MTREPKLKRTYMSEDLFVAVERYIEALFAPSDPVLDAALQSASEARLPQIQISATHGKLLHVLARLCGARRILELGTLAGYSTIWLGRALPEDGRLISLEADPVHAEIARRNLSAAGLSNRVEVVVGKALETLPQLAERSEAPFDMVFIDADKENYPAYLDWSLRLTRPGGLIVADNVIRAGKVLDPANHDSSAQGAHDFNATLAADPRAEAIVLQQVGLKGHDGLALAIVKG